MPARAATLCVARDKSSSVYHLGAVRHPRDAARAVRLSEAMPIFTHHRRGSHARIRAVAAEFLLLIASFKS
jgi:hypothetical protein